MSAHLAAATDRVLIVGAGLSGSLTCFHLRRALRERVRIDVADMARGAGGRMSTTRYEGDKAGGSVRANTGAQYVSAASRGDAADLLEAVCASNGVAACALEKIADPAPRALHFRDDGAAYEHWLPRDGTNGVVKQFLYGGAPDSVSFGARLQRIAADEAGRLRPVFDRGAGVGDASYAAVVLAMPPKDILKFFDAPTRAGDDRQSQAALHRRTNRGVATTLPAGFGPVALPSDVVATLASVRYVGRYSLALWFGDDALARSLADAWRARADGGEPHDVLDVVLSQPGGVVVAQTTDAFWRRVSGLDGGRGGGGGKRRRGAGGRGGRGGRGGGGDGGGGGRDAARSAIFDALAALSGRPLPRAKHMKLLNWRTSQVDSGGLADPPVVTAADGSLVFTGDWCVESSYEGCHRAALAAAGAVAAALEQRAS